MRTKIDYNHIVSLICEAVNDDFRITIGLAAISSYLKAIAERAVEIDDKVLKELLKDMSILKDTSTEE